MGKITKTHDVFIVAVLTVYVAEETNIYRWL